MRKLIFFVLIIFSSINILGQLNGDGLTPATAYYGNLNSGTVTWNFSSHPGGIVYVGRMTPLTADVTISETGRLIIEGGMTLIFGSTISDMRVENGGRLEAIGTPMNKVTFTKLSSIAYWGHIVFKNSPGTSILDHCIIESGRAPSIDGFSGGGIYAISNNLTISNCLIRNNYAPLSGGGIYAVGTITIQNCVIHSNTAGGGDVTDGGGGMWLSSNASVSNCTVVNNISSELGLGDDIFFGSANVTVRNTLVWRPSVYGFSVYFSASPLASNLTNCAFFEAWDNSFNEIDPSFFTSSFKLNPVNDADDGPNFIDPANYDFHIILKSPCVNAGTNTGTPAPPAYDFDGNPRIGIYDIGAYEVQYCGWKVNAATSEWGNAANWDGGVPTIGNDVLIPSGAVNYPTSTPAPDFTLGTGKQFIIEPGACVTLNTLTNYGTLRLRSSATQSASLILSGYNRMGVGTEAIELYLTGGGTEEEENFKWHFISTPVTSLSVDVFMTYGLVDLAQYVESRPTFSLLQGWVAHDGYIYMTGQTNGPTFSSLVPGKGYDYFDYEDRSFTFSGDFNLNDVVANLGFSGDAYYHGFNLLGNPFSCGLDWDYIVNSGSYPANTSRALYFTRDNQQMTYANGVGIPSDVNGIIPPMQGFFNKTYSSGNSITLPLAARTHSNIHDRYKKGTEDIIPLIRFEYSENSLSDETVVRFDNEAKTGLDYEFDAIKMYVSQKQPYLYSVTSGVKFAINAQPFPEQEIDIPLVVNVTKPGNHFLKATQIQGLDYYYLTLIDNVTGYKVDLRNLPRLIFNAPAGTYSDRFVLKVSTFPTGTENPLTVDKNFNIYQAYGLLNIEPLADVWNGKTGTIRILDLTGKPVNVSDNKEFNVNSLIQLPEPAVKGLYFVEIRSGSLKYTGKVIIK